jgi:hypothetical protein
MRAEGGEERRGEERRGEEGNLSQEELVVLIADEVTDDLDWSGESVTGHARRGTDSRTEIEQPNFLVARFCRAE